MHYGYLEDKDIIDTTIFVKENERSYVAVAIFQGRIRSVFKKDKLKLLNRMSHPIDLNKSWIKKMLDQNVDKYFEQNSLTRDIKDYLISCLVNENYLGGKNYGKIRLN
jgi:hypothetical protein